MNDQEFLDEATSHYRLFMSGEEAMATMVYTGRHRAELQLYSTHEESDIRMVKHARWSCETRDARVVLFPMIQMCLHYPVTTTKSVDPRLNPHWMKGFVLISLQQSRSTNVIPQILVIHAISGCDTVAASYGIDKLKAIATSNKGLLLDSFGVEDIPWNSVMNEASSWLPLMGIRCNHEWVPPTDVGAKTAKSSSAPELCSLATTTETFRQNAKRAHF